MKRPLLSRSGSPAASSWMARSLWITPQADELERFGRRSNAPEALRRTARKGRLTIGPRLTSPWTIRRGCSEQPDDQRNHLHQGRKDNLWAVAMCPGGRRKEVGPNEAPHRRQVTDSPAPAREGSAGPGSHRPSTYFTFPSGPRHGSVEAGLIGTSPGMPHWKDTAWPVELRMMNHVPVEGRHTAMSTRPS